ncbi:MAG: hypothetical protein HLUCCA12_14390 [Rhodobacteraceae bacterium HLUCCA12]|nr:MAG: hypothetical protein HLUCCA12_14390 [Rhodobacteraceae bacterium HLUCCA12]
MNDQQPEPHVADAAQTIFLVGEDDSALAAIVSFLGTASPGLSLQRKTDLGTALAQDLPGTVVVPITMPLQHVATMLSDGIDVEQALARWRDHADHVLGACRKHRRRVVLMDAEVIRSEPAALAGALGARLGVQFGARPDAGTTRSSNRTEILIAIAATALALDTKAQALADELEAMMVGPVSTRAPKMDTARIAAEKLGNLSQERDLLRETLRQMVENTESLISENKALSDRPLLKAQSDALQRQLEEARDSQRLREAVLGAEILRLSALLHEERGRLSAELHGALDEIARLLSSTSWKVTRPIRAVRRSLSR